MLKIGFCTAGGVPCGRLKAAGPSRLRLLLVSLPLGLALALGLTAAGAGMGRFADTCAAVRADTLRLHIVAASNTVWDQTLKLRVRDAVLAEAAQLCAQAKTEPQAKAILTQNLPALVRTAEAVLARAGDAQAVSAQMERGYFSTAHYRDAALPAGTYDAVRITLGAGAGHNWWCCLYPSLCLAASGARYDTPAENALVLGGCEVRLAAVEWWEKQKARGAGRQTQTVPGPATQGTQPGAGVVS